MIYNTTCPTCLTKLLKKSPSRVEQSHVPVACGEIGNDPFIQVTCPRGHVNAVYPMDGLFTPMFIHALQAFSSGLLYEAASAGYAALENYMKTYVMASNWTPGKDDREKVLSVYGKQLANKLLMSDSQRIIGAYIFCTQANTGEVIAQHPFETLSHLRNDIIHATKVPESNSVSKLLCGIYRHINHSMFDWTTSLVDQDTALFPLLPLFTVSLSTAETYKDLPDDDTRLSEHISPSISTVFDMHKVFQDDTDKQKYLKTIAKEGQDINKILLKIGIQMQSNKTPSPES